MNDGIILPGYSEYPTAFFSFSAKLTSLISFMLYYHRYMLGRLNHLIGNLTKDKEHDTRQYGLKHRRARRCRDEL